MADAIQSDRACLRFGWTALVIFASLGLALESLHLIKAPYYLQTHIRQELWTLAHAHGTLLALINILFGLYAAKWIVSTAKRNRASVALRLAGVLMPVGFFLGGIGNTESDPSLAIILVPIGALLLIYAAVVAAVASWRDQRP